MSTDSSKKQINIAHSCSLTGEAYHIHGTNNTSPIAKIQQQDEMNVDKTTIEGASDS